MYEKVSQAENWKDRLAGWHLWRIFIPQCQECKVKGTSFTLHGTEQDAKRFAGDTSKHYCDSCS